MNKKKNNSWKWILGVILFLAFIFFLWKVIPHSTEETQLNCEDTYFMKMGLEPFDSEYLDYHVVDFYVDKKEISPFYWNKICYDLLKVRLNDTLSKSENLWLDTRYNYYHEEEVELECNYAIYWGEEGDFYGRDIESGIEFFSSEDVILAQSKRPLKYNESLITTQWREEFLETRIINDNPDYFVVVNLELNETIEVCE